METVQSALASTRQATEVFSLDLQDAYFKISIRQTSRGFRGSPLKKPQPDYTSIKTLLRVFNGSPSLSCLTPPYQDLREADIRLF